MRPGGKVMRWETKLRARPLATMLQATCLMLPLGGCLLTGDQPDPALDIPTSYDGVSRNPSVVEAKVPPLDWWRAFRSAELTAIVEEARVSNLDIAAAVARIVQADAQARIAGAALLPEVDLNANATQSRSSSTLGTGVSAGPRTRNVYQATLNASYEIDFWGKNAAALRAAEETAIASRYDREVVGLATVVSAANAYFQVLAAQDRLAAGRENIRSATRVLDL